MNRSVEDRSTVPGAVSGVVLGAVPGAVSGDATVVVSG
jgi:hypothetical protein